MIRGEALGKSTAADREPCESKKARNGHPSSQLQERRSAACSYLGIISNATASPQGPAIPSSSLVNSPMRKPRSCSLPSCKAGGQGDLGLLQAEAPNGWESCGAPELHPALCQKGVLDAPRLFRVPPNQSNLDSAFSHHLLAINPDRTG